MPATASEILPGKLWVRAHTGNLSPEAKRELATRLRLTGVVCVARRGDPDWIQVPGVYYHHWPWYDSHHELPADLWKRADFLAMGIASDLRYLLFCYGGRNRSGLLAVATVKLLERCSGKEALAIALAGRPNLLVNPYFRAKVEAWL